MQPTCRAHLRAAEWTGNANFRAKLKHVSLEIEIRKGAVGSLHDQTATCSQMKLRFCFVCEQSLRPPVPPRNVEMSEGLTDRLDDCGQV